MCCLNFQLGLYRGKERLVVDFFIFLMHYVNKMYYFILIRESDDLKVW